MSTSTSLQIPPNDPSSSRHNHHNPPAPPPNTSRAVSVAVHSTVTAPPVASRRQQRASHTVGTSQPQPQNNHASSSNHASGQNQHRNNGPDEGLTPPMIDIYSHPAAVAYMNAHPRRQIPKFGPYLLLQTLGEGEFGKVKLGLHCQWGEEVAVKLIRRGSVDNTVRMSKVEREIQVLRILKHPNIVRLYDVIETDKYIGIIIEYASGGELFDHILAHRYLREKDAAKLFSQLISGVWYIHQKKIVHRDLKLENLLLDRNRNVIITDFGFANRFEHRADDLMQTSCGSPCYAAPELVISEGLYVGSAVDIWSCGVILYAMLAGYLPFDDDPANPDGDNINLLYRYIVNTPLTFPDYISNEARDLLSIMLVPDPKRRASLDDVMAHPWLSAYHIPKIAPPEMVTAFGRSVEELERAALDQHNQKRVAYQKQMRTLFTAAPAQPSLADSSRATKAQSHRPEPTSRVPKSATAPVPQPDLYYETSADTYAAANKNTVSPATAALVAAGNSNGAKKGPTIGVGDDDDPFAAPGGTSSALSPITPAGQSMQSNLPVPVSAHVNGSKAPDDDKKHKPTGSGGGGGGFRHTIQVEYNSPSSEKRRGSEDRRDRSGSRGQNQASGSATTTNGQATTAKPTKPSQAAVPPPPPLPSSRESSSAATPVSVPPPDPTREQVKPQPATPPEAVDTPNPTITLISKPILPPPPSVPAPTPPPATQPDVQIQITNPPETTAEEERGSQRSEASDKGHKKGRSSVDKVGLGKIFGGGSTGGSSTAFVGNSGTGSSLTANDRVPSESSVSNGTSATASATSSVVTSPTPTEKPKDGKKSRRNTLTVMVEPFSRSIRGRGKDRKTPTATPAASSVGDVSKAERERKGERSTIMPTSAAAAPPVPNKLNASVTNVAAPVSSFANGSRTELDRGASTAGMGASSSKAKKVMEWFRSKSKGRDSVGIGGEFDDASTGSRSPQPPYATPLTSEVQQAPLHARSVTSGSIPSPQVIITTPTSAKPSYRAPPLSTNISAPGSTHRTPSTATDNSVATPSLVTRFRNSVTVGGHYRDRTASSSHKSSAVPPAPQTPGGTLRIHHGAVDQDTITTGQPPEVMKHVREVLERMGVEIDIESEYKYRCIRPKKRKGIMSGGPINASNYTGSNGATSAANGANGIAAITMVGSAASNGVDKRGLPVPSSSSSFSSATGGMLRGLLMRRQSSQVSNSGQSQSGLEDDNFVPVNGVVGEPGQMTGIEPVYGDIAQDAGDEVRFSVELTRLDRLNDTYSLDIRRLKGNLRSYKFLYDTLKNRANLQR